MPLLSALISEPVQHLAAELPVWTLVPFVLMLAAVAVAPLFFAAWWEHHLNKLLVALTLSLPVIFYLTLAGHGGAVQHSLLFDYVPFVILLAALFTVTGGIAVTGDIEATPLTNALFLLTGALLASVMGTTGAAMLLIRPLLQTNCQRRYKSHTVLFLIAVVANCGGLLTPLGDPPLFILYLRGVPFGWFAGLWKIWLLTVGLLLVIYFFVDAYFYSREDTQSIALDKREIVPLAVSGGLNIIWLAGVALSIAFINEQFFPALADFPALRFLREAAIGLMMLCSLFFTPEAARRLNRFSWSPVQEVAAVFFGIFITMTPCVLYLSAHAGELGVRSATEFYYAAGALSAVLDNAPTALTFYSLALGLNFTGSDSVAGVPPDILISISVASVFFGSLTYIGNGPNLMVKAVAEAEGIEMPDFFKYVYGFSLIVLLPVFVLVQLVFIR